MPQPQSKTIYYVEGNPVALLITNKLGRMAESKMRFATAELALAWCRKNLATLVYLSVNLQSN